MTARLEILLPERELLAGRDQQLLLDQVGLRHHFGDRVLDLDARVHFDEIELAVVVQELHRAGAAIADALAGVGAQLADVVTLRLGDARRWRLFDDLLVAALHRAIALAQMHDVAVFVGQYLNLDVARHFQILLQEHRAVAECRLRFGTRHVYRLNQVFL